MTSFLTDPYLLVHASALLSLMALAFRDQLKLRTILLLSIILSLIYHLFAGRQPAWQEVFWNLVTIIVDSVVLSLIILDRTQIGLSKEQEELFKAFNSLTPGEFRALIRVATWKTADENTVLTTEGVTPDRLFYVLRGALDIRKGERRIVADPRTFIGEVAFLHHTPASATVMLAPGTRYLEWPVEALQKKMGAKRALNTSVIRLIGLDMALKVARG